MKLSEILMGVAGLALVVAFWGGLIWVYLVLLKHGLRLVGATC